MNSHALIPLAAMIAYVPLALVSLFHRPWQKQQGYFVLYLIPAMLWSLSDFFLRSDFLNINPTLLAKVIICMGFWMMIQFHYVLSSYHSKPGRIPFAFLPLAAMIALVVLDRAPSSVVSTEDDLAVEYGLWTVLSAIPIVDGSNAFIYSRFLVPHLQNYQGWAIFMDGDMVVRDDIANLWTLRDDRFAAMVVKHDYQTRAHEKYLGNVNEDYPRKNWSSVILWNCGHPANKHLTPGFVETATGAQLHRFQHLKDEEIGGLPKLWNWLAEEYPANNLAQLVHYTLGTPCFRDYANCETSEHWRHHYHKAVDPMPWAHRDRPAVF